MNASCLTVSLGRTASDWSGRLCEMAFENLQESIVESSMSRTGRPHNALLPDETIWGRCPARIELAGGWTDTPPYTLEYGGDVTNTAIELTTLAGIPQGSGLGTSSILGATILGVIARLTGKTLTQQELFHNVLPLEQALTTGGGWQG